MPPPSVGPYLTDIIEAIDHVREKTGGATLEEFNADWERQWIVQRGIEIISEASRRLPDELKVRHPNIPWSRVAPVGNVLRHEYRQVAPPLIWEIVRRHLPALENVCREELAVLEKLERNQGGCGR